MEKYVSRILFNAISEINNPAFFRDKCKVIYKAMMVDCKVDVFILVTKLTAPQNGDPIGTALPSVHNQVPSS